MSFFILFFLIITNSAAKVTLFLLNQIKKRKKNIFFISVFKLNCYLYLLLLVITVHTCSGIGQEVHPIPAHLKQQKTDDKGDVWDGDVAFGRLAETTMDIHKIGTPCGCRPCLLGIPSPIASPCLFCPYTPRDHTEREECHTYIHQYIG